MSNAAVIVDAPPPSSSRAAEAEVDPLFIGRWSTRAFSPVAVPSQLIHSLFEAARWAPSAANVQPWLFVYASDEATLARARPLLKDSNQRWAAAAPLLIFVFTRRTHPETGQPLRTSAFDTGAAWLSLALQAERLGLRTHAMGGIHHERTYAAFDLPEAEFESLAAIAVGYPGDSAALPADLAAKELPNGRKRQAEFVFHGTYSR